MKTYVWTVKSAEGRSSGAHIKGAAAASKQVAATMRAMRKKPMTENPTYDKLIKAVWESFYPGKPMYPRDTGEVIGMYANVDGAVNAVWPEFVELLAKIAEYEHALEHAADITTHQKYEQIYCEDCARLAQSAIDGVNRDDFRSMILDD